MQTILKGLEVVGGLFAVAVIALMVIVAIVYWLLRGTNPFL